MVGIQLLDRLAHRAAFRIREDMLYLVDFHAPFSPTRFHPSLALEHLDVLDKFKEQRFCGVSVCRVVDCAYGRPTIFKG